MKKHFIIIVGIVVIIVIGLFLYFFDPIKKYVVYQKALLGLSGNEAVLVLDNGQEERMFRGEVVDGMTVADVLGAASLAGNFDCRLNSGIDSLDGLASGGQMNWHCFLNGKEVGDQLASEAVRAKDKIICRYK
jgi:hypothetical protein